MLLNLLKYKIYSQQGKLITIDIMRLHQINMGTTKTMAIKNRLDLKLRYF